MATAEWRRPKVERQLVGEPVLAGDISVEPVAQLEFSQGGRTGQAGGGGGGRLRLRPVEVIVRRDGQPEQRIAVGEMQGRAYRAMLAAGAGVMAASIVFSIVMGLRRRG